MPLVAALADVVDSVSDTDRVQTMSFHTDASLHGTILIHGMVNHGADGGKIYSK